MTRLPGHNTREGQLWYAEVAHAQREVQDAERRRDELVVKALAHGLGVRGVAKALRIDKATVSRRYGHNTRETPT
jgi:DNA invertase Pin-like site-specific DNA recombinase